MISQCFEVQNGGLLCVTIINTLLRFVCRGRSVLLLHEIAGGYLMVPVCECYFTQEFVASFKHERAD